VLLCLTSLHASRSLGLATQYPRSAQRCRCPQATRHGNFPAYPPLRATPRLRAGAAQSPRLECELSTHAGLAPPLSRVLEAEPVQQHNARLAHRMGQGRLQRCALVCLCVERTEMRGIGWARARVTLVRRGYLRHQLRQLGRVLGHREHRGTNSALRSRSSPCTAHCGLHSCKQSLDACVASALYASAVPLFVVKVASAVPWLLLCVCACACACACACVCTCACAYASTCV
jgi:hypothetical protein